MKNVVCTLLLALTFSAVASAQTVCEDGETPNTCLERLLSESPLAEVSEDVRAKAVSEGSPATASSIQDFLSTFFTSVGLGTVSPGDGSLTFAFRPDFLELGPQNPLSLKAVLREGKPFEPIVAALPEDERAAFRTSLEDRIGDFDDFEVSVRWTREDERFGRSVLRSRTPGRLLATLSSRVQDATDDLQQELLLEFIRDHRINPNVQVAQMNPPDRERFERALVDAVAEIRAEDTALRQALSQARFFEIADLVNNQPQLYATASYRRRDEVTGPDLFSASFSYEVGFANLNGLRKYCREQGQADVEPACLGSFLDRKGGAVENAPRLAISAQFSRSDEYDTGLPGPARPFHLDRLEERKGSLAFGRYLRPLREGDGPQTTRFDLEVSYEDVTGDEARQDRLVSTATLSRKLTGDFSASLSFVYANKPEYRGEVDEELSARAGLRFKMDTGDE